MAADNNGVGIPPDDSWVTAGGTGHNDDNGVQKNSGTPLGNACPAFFFPTITTQLKKASDNTNVSGPLPFGSSVYDTSTLSGAGGAIAGGTVEYRAYSDLSVCNAGTYASQGPAAHRVRQVSPEVPCCL